MKKKNLLIITALLLLAATASIYVYWNKPARNVTAEKALNISATALFEQYVKDEKAANTLYLDKALLVTGKVVEVKTNADGKTVCILQTSDPFFGIQCSFAEATSIQNNSTITVKGICTGYLSGADVVMKDCRLP